MRRALLLLALIPRPGWGAGADPYLGSPRVADMLLTGMTGSAHSSVSRSLLQVGRYLYVSGEPGLQTIDAADPEHLRLVSDWPNSSYKMNGAAEKGGVLFVANWAPAEGLLLFDLAEPARPKLLKTIPTPIHSWSVDITGNLMDVGLGNETTSIVLTYDVRDPRNPVLVGRLQIDERIAGNPRRHGNYLYLTHGDKFYVYDVREPMRPVRIKTLNFESLCGQLKLYKGYLYMLQFAVFPEQKGGLRVFSLDNPASPESIYWWDGEPGPRSMNFQNGLLVVPASGSGLYTIDVSDPRSPKVLSNWGVNWPQTKHGGYSVTAAGDGKFAFIGTTGGNNPECESWRTCSYWGGRVYSVQITAKEPPPPFVPAPRGVSGAVFVRQTPPPARMAPGQEAVVSITLRNSGRAAWSASQGYKLGAQGPADNALWRTGRIPLAEKESVPAGAARTFTFRVKAPARPGTYPFQWRMVAEKSEWFGQASAKRSIVVR
ncbi:MAG: hypothetical protein HY925_09495 [Elusimicrobia bacterium]|nr:hypothetical protein [Elusimicrobiota bacterium]